MKMRIAVIAACAATFALAQVIPAQAAQVTSISNIKKPPGLKANGNKALPASKSHVQGVKGNKAGKQNRIKDSGILPYGAVSTTR